MGMIGVQPNELQSWKEPVRGGHYYGAMAYVEVDASFIGHKDITDLNHDEIVELIKIAKEEGETYKNGNWDIEDVDNVMLTDLDEDRSVLYAPNGINEFGFTDEMYENG